LQDGLNELMVVLPSNGQAAATALVMGGSVSPLAPRAV
jgi:hypothetical protein